MSNGVAFDSLESAKAALSLGPVQFRCLCCGRSHSSRGGGWSDCARKFSRSRPELQSLWTGGDFYHLDARASSSGSLPGAALLGRERLLPREVFSWQVSAPLAPVCAVLALTEKAFRDAVRVAKEAWWKEVLSKVSLMAETLRRVFPGATSDLSPAVSLPAWGEATRYAASLYLPTAEVALRNWAGGLPGAVREVQVKFYVGTSFTVSGPDLGDRVPGLVEAVEGKAVEIPAFPEVKSA